MYLNCFCKIGWLVRAITWLPTRNTVQWLHDSNHLSDSSRGVTTGGKGGILPGRQVNMGVPNHCGRAPKCPNNVTSTFFNTVDLLPKKLRFEHGEWGRQTCFLPRALSTLVTSLDSSHDFYWLESQRCDSRLKSSHFYRLHSPVETSS